MKRRVATRTKSIALALPIFISFLLAACGGGTSASGGSGSSNSVNAGSSGIPATGTLTLTWDPVSGAPITGYKLYFSTAPFSSMTPPNTVDVGLDTSYRFVPNGLTVGTTVYFAIAAVDSSNSESPLSNAVSIALQ